MARRAVRSDDRGAVLVEFGLLLPVFIGVFLGIVTIGLAFFARLQMTSAVQEGARVVYTNGTPGDALAAAAAVYPLGTATVTGISGSGTCASSPGTLVTVRMTRAMTIRYLIGSSTVTMEAQATTRCTA